MSDEACRWCGIQSCVCNPDRKREWERIARNEEYIRALARDEIRQALAELRDDAPLPRDA